MFLKKKCSAGILVLVLMILWSCKKDAKINPEIAKVPVQLKVSRFDKMLSKADATNLPELKTSFPFLFNSRVPDSVWVKKLTDPIQKELLEEVAQQFSDFNSIELELESFYKHLTYYYPEFKIPELVTLINEVDYRNKVIVTDSLVLVALDNYLGEGHRFYQNISKYISSNMKPSQIVSDVAQQYAKKSIIQESPKTFLEEMVFQGKQLYFKDVMMPLADDTVKLGYSLDQLNWARENEAAIWTYFIEKELLYSTDSKLNGRFINPAPYSKFYLELDNESPGRLGVYMGWQIVRAYAEQSEQDIFTIMRKPAQELFKESKFKPRK